MGNLYEFTQGQIKVECPYPIQRIEMLEVTRKLNQHGEVFIRGILPEEDGEGCIRSVGGKDYVVVLGKNSAGEKVLFSGVVTHVEVFCKNYVYYVEIKGLSWSSLLDYQKKSRSFQEKAMSYATLIQQVISDYKGSIFFDEIHASETAIGQLILQYRETDWEFCKRLATHFHTQLVADISGKTPEFHFGLPEYRQKLHSVEKKVIMNEKCHIQSMQRIELGIKVEFEGCSWIVKESKFFLDKGVLWYTYMLILESSFCVSRETNPRIQGISLLGKVLERENQRIKLKLEIDKKQDVNTACWFPYAAQANNLFYCMPEIGSMISLYFSNNNESSGIAMNAVRKNGSNCAKTSNPKLKYMGIPQGKEFKLGITDINFTAHEKLFMWLKEERGVLVQSHEDLNVFAKQKLLMEAKEVIKVFAKTGNIIVGAKEESALYLMGGADGDTHIKAGKNIIYEGRRKEIYTERLNSEITYEEKKFDWGKLARNVLIGLAAVALVAVTAGAAAIALGAAAATVGAVTMGAAISGSIAVGVMAASDIIRGEVSDLDDYVLAGVKGAIEGAVSGAILGVKALEGAKLIEKMLVGGGVSFLTDTISQGIDMLYHGNSYDWKRGLLSFGIGFFMPAVSAGIRKGINKFLDRYGKQMPKWLSKSFCKLGGDPVDLISGNVLYYTTDFELPGPLPLQWQRIWCSANKVTGHLGHGTRYNYEMGLEILEENHAIAVFLQDGRVGMFPTILVGEETFSYDNRLLLKRNQDHYQLFDPESRYTYLLYPSPGGYLPYKLTKIHNFQGHQIQFMYDKNGYLCQITDSVGRKLDVVTNAQGRIVQVVLRGTDNKASAHVLVCYGYNGAQDLETITDAVGVDVCLKYRNHLLIRKTDRNGSSFYWEYDRYEDGARAVRTWGDEGVLSLWITYHEEEGYNSVKTSRKSTPSEYHYDEKMLCTRIVYPDLTEIKETYDDKYRLVSKVDEEGRLTSFQYNDWSQITVVTRPDASRIKFSYDGKGRLVEMVHPEGNCRKWIYNDDDSLNKVIDEGGIETTYKYNSDGLVDKVRNAKGQEIWLEYDDYLNLKRMTLPNGSTSVWEYDERGNCLTARNPLGAVETYQYDKLNRLVKAKLADGNEIQLAYNGYEDVIFAKDQYTEVFFTYTILGSIASKTQDKRKITYEYNSEEQLISITNEKGEAYRFERDVKGNVIKEVGYDNLTRTYERDYSGLVTKINRPGGRFTKYSYDKLGRIVRVDYHDKSYEAFTYNKNGALTEAENKHTKVKLERDRADKVTKEWQNKHWISSNYDELGKRIQVTSNFGTNILTERNEMGQATHIVAYMEKGTPWIAKMEYNPLGQETQCMVSGDICSQWEYDTTGRPIYHVVNGKEGDVQGSSIGYTRTLRQRRYEWDVNNRLKKVTNEQTKGTTMYSYDQFNNLVSAKETGLETIFRETDTVGNLYVTQDRSDRIYGAGSRLEKSGIDLKEKRNSFQGGYGKLVTKGTEYFYDEEGNMVEKTESNGDTWRYLYYGNGMLKKVVLPDGSGVCFKYDPFGRRIEKSVTKGYSKKTVKLKEQVPAINKNNWEVVGGARIRRPHPQKENSHVAKDNATSIYQERRGESEEKVEKVIRFLWDGNTLLHEWKEKPENTLKVKAKVDYKADFRRKQEKQREQDIAESPETTKVPESLITWIFQDDFIPRGKITSEGNYSIITDYLGTPVEAYGEEGNKIWEREFDIYGSVKPGRKDTYGKPEKNIGEENFIPFRFQGQYQDEKIGLYYNRFRYYDPQLGQYTQQDPIGLAGGNPTLYGYVKDTNTWIDIYGLKSFFRSMSRAEFFDILDYGWRTTKGKMETKWFADSFEDAISFGQKMGHGVDSKFYILEVDIPDNIVEKAFRNFGKHDGIGPASCFEIEDLNSDSVTIKSRNSIRADRKQQKLGGC